MLALHKEEIVIPAPLPVAPTRLQQCGGNRGRRARDGSEYTTCKGSRTQIIELKGLNIMILMVFGS